MLYSKGRRRNKTPGGFYQLESTSAPHHLTGFGDGEFVRLKDENGEVWHGSAQVQSEDMVRYQFRNAKGKSISGMADSNGILLRDERGNTWRGFVL